MTGSCNDRLVAVGGFSPVLLKEKWAENSLGLNSVCGM